MPKLLETFTSLPFLTITPDTMIQTSQVRPAKKFGPGYFIREQLELREWNQEELAEITAFSQKHISDLLNNKKSISLDTARILGEVFDTSAQYWLNLDNEYRIWLRQEPNEKEKEADTKAMIYERMPIRDMIKKGWLAPPQSTEDLKQKVLNFWGKTTLNFDQEDATMLPYLTRKSTAYNKFNAAYAITWYKKALSIADQITVNAFDAAKLGMLCEQITDHTLAVDGVAIFLEKLKQIGVKFMVLPHLEKTYLDGAAFFSNNNPTVVYTGRYKRLDHFWFTLTHELAHVLLHLNSTTTFILDNLQDGERDQMENEANALAGRFLKHSEIAAFLKNETHYLSANRVEECATTYNVHPSIVIGKLAHDGKTPYRNLTRYHENALDLIPNEYKF